MLNGMTTVILKLVKTAISLPDDLFQRAEAVADRNGIARSQLYALALAEYLDRHSDDWVTAALDSIYTAPSPVEREMAAAQADAIEAEDW